MHPQPDCLTIPPIVEQKDYGIGFSITDPVDTSGDYQLMFEDLFCGEICSLPNDCTSTDVLNSPNV